MFKCPKSIPSSSHSIIIQSSSIGISSNANKTSASSASSKCTSNNGIDTNKSLNISIPSMKLPVTISSQLSECPSDLVTIVNSMEVPQKEIEINQQEITKLEKYFHCEFFEGRPTKTPERYMKIRNFIVNAWKASKPIYISKTSVRNGLKHCGDVNCISRIHSLLEQTGVINFGCEQLTYIRPLRELIDWFAQSIRSNKQMSNVVVSNLLERRPRIKNAPTKITSSSMHLASNTRLSREPIIDANYTVSHDDGTIVLPNFKQKRLEDDSTDDDEDTNHRQTVHLEHQLIQCLRYDNRDVAPFTVSITLSTLLCLQLHSLSAKHEVMGFLGGHQTKVGTNQMKLHLTRYKPCQTSAQSSIMCEMCPGEFFFGLVFFPCYYHLTIYFSIANGTRS